MEVNNEIPPCIQIPPQYSRGRYYREIKIAPRSRIIHLLISTCVVLVVGLSALAVTLEPALTMLYSSLMTLCMIVILVLSFTSFFTILIPSDAHVCDLRIAVARYLNVDPTYLEISTLTKFPSDNEDLYYESWRTEYYYDITGSLARGVIAELYNPNICCCVC